MQFNVEYDDIAYSTEVFRNEEELTSIVESYRQILITFHKNTIIVASVVWTTRYTNLIVFLKAGVTRQSKFGDALNIQ